MKDHKKILELIENVDPDDPDTLDEIDARVTCYSQEKRYIRHETSDYDRRIVTWVADFKIPFVVYEYTRSRDALKAIRPEGWWFELAVATVGFNASMWLISKARFSGLGLPTEELAELHAIIQAIAYERDNKNLLSESE